MADAIFEAYIKPQRGKHIVVGRTVDIDLEVQVPKSHSDVELKWEVGWQASGRETDSHVVDSGRFSVAELTAGQQHHWSVAVELPADGPVSYRGRLLEVSWFLKATLDIPWALDPKSVFGFEVRPGRLKRTG